MIEKEPILSICIPTYNRAKYLANTLATIVSQKRFYDTFDVEIIIVNNGSVDETEGIAQSVIKKYPQKIRYHHYKENSPRNIFLCLELGKGKYVKLNNDTLEHKEGTLNSMIRVLENSQNNNCFFCFCNGAASKKDVMVYDDIDGFVSGVSFYSTWIAMYMFAKKDIESFDFNRKWETLLPQVDFAFRLINFGRRVVVNNDIIFESINPLKKGGYDLLKIFLDEYLFFLTEQLDNGKLSKKVYQIEKRKLLMNFILPWLVRIKVNKADFSFTTKNSFAKINQHYKSEILLLFKFYKQYYRLFFSEKLSKF
jgi:abequosyltransferase